MNLFTIITVCYNAEREIKGTIESVLKQTYTNYEYLIVDGLSDDDTVEIAKFYCEQFQQKGITYTIKSEKDTGIYNAMNKATDMASGKWLLFLNAGDRLVDEKVLAEVAKNDCDNTAILYGDVFYCLYKLYKKIPAGTPDELKNGMVFCHQSAFIARKKMAEYRYDESYRIGADYDFICRCYKSGEQFKKLDIPISVFELGGASSNPVKHMFEQLKIQNKNSLITEEEYEEAVVTWKKKEKYYKMRDKIEKIVPSAVTRWLRRLKYKQLGYEQYLG